MQKKNSRALHSHGVTFIINIHINIFNTEILVDEYFNCSTSFQVSDFIFRKRSYSGINVINVSLCSQIFYDLSRPK